MHVAICDQKGKDGPRHPDAKFVAARINIMVDYAKHAKCIKPEDYEKSKKLVEEGKYPDFLGRKANTESSYQSKNILGQLYRNVEI